MTLHSSIIAAAIASGIAACLLPAQTHGAAAEEKPAQAPPAAPASIEDVPLIPRDALFGNPERTDVQISPDGKYLSWIAAVDGVLNVWVAPAVDMA